MTILRSRSRMCLSVCVGAALLTTLTPPATAQKRTLQDEEAEARDSEDGTAGDKGPTEYRFEFALVAGYQIFYPQHGILPTVDDPTELSPRSAFASGLRLTLNFNSWVALEGEASAAFTKPRGDGLDVSQTMWNMRMNVVLNCAVCFPFRPFAMVGVGGSGVIVDKDTVTYRNKIYEYDAADETVHAGVGFKIFFSERMGLRFDGVVLAPPACPFPFAKLSKEATCTGPDWQILGSLFFNFSEVPKSTRRFIYKKEVVMVQAPPPPPPKPEPPADPDGDGIAGAADKCPLIAEDRDGFADEDGCPDPDNDGDGVLDVRDKCPNQPETRNGIDDEDGCPEEDTDGDGFIGSADKCPEAPETKNNFKDDDGCPDEIPAAVKKFTGVIDGINFKTGSADILPGSYAVLDRAVAVLKDYTDIRMEISGHTDNRGGQAHNLDLSQRRAQSVRNYFILRGISGERLTAAGYGFDKPVADNDTEYGRSRNRRTEFKLLGAN